jgi:hypothetical protein
MSLFDDASLVITPSGYKEGKLYSIKPTDGSGDLSVTRATTATRVDANGLVEIPRTNLATYSEDFTNVIWQKFNATVSGNSTTAPNGTTTADKIVENTSNASHYLLRNISLTNSVTYKFSTYLKADGRTRGRVRIIGSGTYWDLSFNLQDGIVAGATGATIENVGNGWYRISGTFTTNQASNDIIIFLSDSTSGNSGFNYTYTGNGVDGILVWGTQVETGSVLTEYIPTIASIRTKFAGITQDGGSASNIPRLDYTNGSCPSILVEPQRTNLALRSEEFNNTSWNVASTSTVTLNAGISPSGNNTANLITATALDGRRIQSVSLSAGTYTYSYFVKKGNQSSIQVLAFNSTLSAVAQSANFDLDNGTLTSGTGIIQQFANGWYRVSVTFTIAATNTILLYIKSGLSNNAIGSTVYAWGAQLEAGSNATSYIPTVAASVTRNADVISKTGISSLIGQTEGTLFVDFYNQLLNSTLLCINKNATNAIFINISNTGTIIGRYYANSILTTTNATTYTTFNQRIKVALKYGSFGIKLFVNGVLKSTNSTSIAFTSSLSDIFLNDGVVLNINEKIINNNVQVYKTALTDEQCINLTTL